MKIVNGADNRMMNIETRVAPSASKNERNTVYANRGNRPKLILLNSPQQQCELHLQVALLLVSVKLRIE